MIPYTNQPITHNNHKDKKQNNPLYYQKMQQPHNDYPQSPSPGELQLSINNINEIMQRINEAVRKSQGQLREEGHGLDTFFTQENLITENVDSEESQLVGKLRAKVAGMRIPLHQLHRKSKLSTVVEESQSQSGRTNKQAATPREVQLLIAPAKCLEKPMGSFTKQVILLGSCETSPCELEDGSKRTKKITGIRKTSNFKISDEMPSERARDKEKRYTKTKSMTNIKCDIFERKRESHAEEPLIDELKNRSKSRGRKGLSLLSKHSLKSEQNDFPLKNIQNSSASQQKLKASTEISSDRKQKGSKTIKIKRRTINPFIMSKQSVQLDRKPEPNKLKNCLSRTNIREFYVSKRISKKLQ